MKKIITYILTFTILICTMICFVGCGERASSFTEEEHIQRITERIKKRDPKRLGFPEGETYQDFEVYPLYNEDDKLQYFLVEFEPYGFMFIALRDEIVIMAHTSLYFLSSSSSIYGEENPWSPYVKDETNSQPDPDRDKSWILDENGERIFYTKSPYFVTGNINEKKYFWRVESGNYICAIKNDTGFINLISGKQVDGSSFKGESTIGVSFINKKNFDL